MDQEKEPEDPHPDFVKGFNEGYSLAKYAPEIGGLFGAYAGETERGKGFRKGKEQYVLEIEKERYPDYLKDISDNKADMGVGKEKSRDELLKDYGEIKSDMGIGKDKDHFTDWLNEKDVNKADMDLDLEPDKDKGDIEPEID